MPHGTESRRKIAFFLFPGFTLLDAAGPIQVFTTANFLGAAVPYEITAVSKQGGPIFSDSGLSINTTAIDQYSTVDIDTLIVVGGKGRFDVVNDAKSIAWLTRTEKLARRMGSICTGAFIVAKAGCTAHRRVVTHWARCDELRSLHPDITVEPEPIYIVDGKYWSSAGVSAGIDFALAMVEQDESRALALSTSKELVLFFKRTGGQSQFSAWNTLNTLDSNDAFSDLHAWILNNLNADLKLDRLADRCCLSKRHFARIYRETTGRTPASVVKEIRLEAAKQLIETTNLPIKSVAARCGFGAYERMRRAFLIKFGVTPDQYKRRFGLS